jgi:hypothetical protein
VFHKSSGQKKQAAGKYTSTGLKIMTPNHPAAAKELFRAADPLSDLDGRGSEKSDLFRFLGRRTGVERLFKAAD